MNDLTNAWLWGPYIKLTILPSPPKIGFARSLKGYLHFLVLVTVHIKFFLYALYFSLLSQLIKINEILSLFPIDVSGLIITTTKPISYAIIGVHCNELSQVANTYKKGNTCLVFLGHSFTYFNLVQNHINTWEVLKVSKQSIYSNTTGSSPLSLFILISSDIMLSYTHSSPFILTTH